MPGEQITEQEIVTLRDRRFKLEQLLALDLVEAITTTPSLIGPLRQMAREAIAEIQSHASGSGVRQRKAKMAMDATFKEEKWLAVWKKFGIDPGSEGLRRISTATHLSVFDISDIVRLYGAFIEQLAKHPWIGDDFKSELEKKDEYRRNIGFANRQTAWGYRRDRGSPKDLSTVSTDNAGAALRGWQAPDFPGHNKPMLKRGIDIKQATGASTVKKIENLFGLPIGADISGTTADSIYFIEKFCNKCNIPYDPIYQLLPLSSIVRARHHALLEVALTLSSHGIVDYHIGFYTTLEPAASTHPAQGKIQSVFRKWDGHNWNKHIIVYFDTAERIAGGWLFRDQLHKYYDLAAVYLNYSEFVSLPKPPLLNSVKTLLLRHGLTV